MADPLKLLHDITSLRKETVTADTIERLYPYLSAPHGSHTAARIRHCV